MKKNIVSVSSFLLILIFVIFILYINKSETATETVFAMDTYMSLSASGKKANEALKKCVEEIVSLDSILATEKENSEVHRLNEVKTAPLSPVVAELFSKSIEISNITDGNFDITVYPVMKLWGFNNGNEKHVPSKASIDKLLPFVDYSLIETSIDSDTGFTSLSMPENVEVDFGGIAKGYTAYRLKAILEKYKIKSALISLGGNIRVIGKKADGSPWKVAIQSPDDSLPYLGVLSVSDKAIVTSGGYERFFEEDGNVYHHIIDPKTGYPANTGLKSVTIVTDDDTLADGLSTALFVMGPKKAIDFYKESSLSFDFVLYTDGNELFISEGLKDAFTSSVNFTEIKK